MKNYEMQQIEKEDDEVNEMNLNKKSNIFNSFINPEFKDDEEAHLLSYEGKDEKEGLTSIFDKLGNELTLGENKTKSIDKIYAKYLSKENLTEREIKKGTNKFLIKFVIYFTAPLFEILYLIGIFQLISIKNSFLDLFKESAIDYYKCTIKLDCNITLNDEKGNVFEFYDYFYNYTMNESIDFNLMMITGFAGDLLIKSKGFTKSSIYLFAPNLIGMFWLNSFDFSLPNEKFDYSLIKIIFIFICYLIILIGVGGSALLSQKILIDYYLKYKDYIIGMKMEKITEMESNLKPENNNEQNAQNGRKSLLNKNEEERQKKREEVLNKRKNNKFDFFYMIVITTTIGYFGKYGINIIINFVLASRYGDKYNKLYFFYCTVGIYIILLFFSIIFYKCFKLIFKKDKNINNDSIGTKLI